MDSRQLSVVDHALSVLPLLAFIASSAGKKSKKKKSPTRNFPTACETRRVVDPPVSISCRVALEKHANRKKEKHNLGLFAQTNVRRHFTIDPALTEGSSNGPAEVGALPPDQVSSVGTFLHLLFGRHGSFPRVKLPSCSFSQGGADRSGPTITIARGTPCSSYLRENWRSL